MALIKIINDRIVRKKFVILCSSIENLYFLFILVIFLFLIGIKYVLRVAAT